MSYGDEEVRAFIEEEFSEAALKGARHRRVDMWRYRLHLCFQRQYEKMSRIKSIRKRGYKDRYWRDKRLRVVGGWSA